MPSDIDPEALSEEALAAMEDHEEYLLLEEFVEYAERHHGGAGVARETLAAYAEHLSSTTHAFPFDPASVDERLDEALTESETWEGPDVLYPVGGVGDAEVADAPTDDRVSVVPAAWHRGLADAESLVAYVDSLEDVFGEGEMGPEADVVPPGAGEGVPEETLVTVAAVVGDWTRDEATENLEAHRDAGRLVEDADQHPNARVTTPSE